MMRRLTGFLICAIPGLLMLVCGLLVPAHLRAVDASVLQKAGRNTAALIEQGLTLVRQNKLGAAQLLLQAAQAEGLPDRQRLGLAITNLAMQHPRWLVWGGGDARLERLFASDPHLPKSGSEPFTDFVVREENRAVVLELLRASPLPAVQELLRCRALTNTVIFSPSQSASGQALDTALAVCGLLLEGGHLSGGLSNAVFALAADEQSRRRSAAAGTGAAGPDVVGPEIQLGPARGVRGPDPGPRDAAPAGESGPQERGTIAGAFRRRAALRQARPGGRLPDELQPDRA